MWNLAYANRKCNALDKFVDHKLFLERIASSKPALKISSPQVFPFLKIKAKKINLEEGKSMILIIIENNIKISYENDLIMKKIIEYETHKTSYHPDMQKHYPHPSSNRFSKTSYSSFEVKRNNSVFSYYII
jgi:hypothetical protein